MPSRYLVILQLKSLKEQVEADQKRMAELQAELDKLKKDNEGLPSLEDIDTAIEYWEEQEKGCKKCGKPIEGGASYPKGGGGPLCLECG